jgi:hypothetical protein
MMPRCLLALLGALLCLPARALDVEVVIAARGGPQVQHRFRQLDQTGPQAIELPWSDGQRARITVSTTPWSGGEDAWLVIMQIEELRAPRRRLPLREAVVISEPHFVAQVGQRVKVSHGRGRRAYELEARVGCAPAPPPVGQAQR